jgi:hypothetical protein
MLAFAYTKKNLRDSVQVFIDRATKYYALIPPVRQHKELWWLTQGEYQPLYGDTPLEKLSINTLNRRYDFTINEEEQPPNTKSSWPMLLLILALCSLLLLFIATRMIKKL